jgi:nucleoside-diphosphate-sugar epimerase
MGGGVAILGAGGFVGARYLEMAVLGGRTNVVPVVRAFRSVGRNAHLGVAHRIGDASRAESLKGALAGCDVVVNLTMGDPSTILGTTENVYTAAVASGARLLVHLSSAAVYEEVARPDLPDDAAPQLGQWMPYGRQKGLAENFLRARMADQRIAIVVLRPGLIWGPGSPWVLGPATELVRGGAYLVGDGHGICNLLFVDNLVRSIDAVIAHPAPTAGFYHVGDNETTTWREYYGALADGLGSDPATIHVLPAGPYRIGLRDRVADVQGLPIYRWLKDRLSVETRSAIKVRFARRRRPGAAWAASESPAITREGWQLRTTPHRLPTTKFRAEYGDQNRTSFASGIAASLAWLRFVGLDDRELVASATPRAPAPVVAGSRG